jgi:hypothetical protein
MKESTRKRNEDVKAEYARLKGHGLSSDEIVASIAHWAYLSEGTIRQILFNPKYSDDANERHKTSRLMIAGKIPRTKPREIPLQRQSVCSKGMFSGDAVIDGIAARSGACEICGRPAEKRRGKTMNLYLDHDHHTGFVRGWLCHRCNLILGLVDDDIGLLTVAIDYLKRERVGYPRHNGKLVDALKRQS